MSKEYIFVYGSLRHEASTTMSQHLHQQCRYISQATIQAKLYEVDGYPGAIQSDNPDNNVIGEIYEIINPAILTELDSFEECSADFDKPHEYKRCRVNAHLADGSILSTWAYLYNKDVSSLFKIQSGDYLKFQSNTIS